MGLRYRKSLKLGSGVKLNINKGSVSLSAGKRGARVTVNSKGQTTKSVGLPGTGLSYRSTSVGGSTRSDPSPRRSRPKRRWGKAAGPAMGARSPVARPTTARSRAAPALTTTAPRELEANLTRRARLGTLSVSQLDNEHWQGRLTNEQAERVFAVYLGNRTLKGQ